MKIALILLMVGLIHLPYLFFLISYVYLFTLIRVPKAIIKKFIFDIICIVHDMTNLQEIKKRNKAESDIFTFGYTPLPTLYRILKKSGVKKGDNILDMGSGYGHIALFAPELFKVNCTGVEIEYVRHKLSLILKKVLLNKKTTFINGDILKFDAHNYNIIFLNNTCYTDFMEVLLTKNLENLKIGTIAVSLSVPVKSKKYEILHKYKDFFSWGRATIYINRKIS